MNYVGFEESVQPVAQTQAPSAWTQWVEGLRPYGQAAPILTMLFAGTTALIAWKALNNWKRQEEHKADVELARKILAVVVDMEQLYLKVKVLRWQEIVNGSADLPKIRSKIDEVIEGFRYLRTEAEIVWGGKDIIELQSMLDLIDDLSEMRALVASNLKVTGAPGSPEDIENEKMWRQFIETASSSEMWTSISNQVKKTKEYLRFRLRPFSK